MSDAQTAAQGQRIGLVTVLFNCEKHLPLFFQSLGQQTDRQFLVIIVDNASKDRSLPLARELGTRHNVECEFISNADNVGIAAGNNQGIQAALARNIQHIVLINNDIECDARLIANIRSRAIDAGLRTWTCLAYRGSTSERWYGGGRLAYWRARGIHFDEARSRTITSPVPVTYAPTCLMYVHASVFQDVGMMDTRYFVYYDDTDFCRRLQDAGITLIYDPKVEFRHYVGGSSGGDLSDFSLRMMTRNKFLYIDKHYRGATRWFVMGLAIASKLVQMTNRTTRKATWLGLQDARRLSK